MVTNKLRSERAYFMCSQEGEDAVVCLKSDVDKVIGKLKRSLWLARAERAAAWQIHFSLCHNNNSIEREFSINGASMPCEGMVTMRTARDWSMIWKKVASKCRAKAVNLCKELMTMEAQ